MFDNGFANRKEIIVLSGMTVAISNTAVSLE